MTAKTKKIKKNADCVNFLGEAANGVTGSMYLVEFEDLKILLECGLYQSSKNDYLDAYKVNSRKFDFDPKSIDAVFVCHSHIDHCGLIPRLVREGYRGPIYMTADTSYMMKPLLLNSSYILKNEAYIMTMRFGREYKPIYEDGDVYAALNLIEPCQEYNHLYRFNEILSFQWLENSHCVGAAQLQLVLTGRHKSRKILYTSDLGPLKSNNHFVRDTYIPGFFNDLVIMESTYGSKSRSKRKSRKFDIEHLKAAIETTLARKGSVIMPAFSFARTQELLVTLYELFGDDPSFTTEVVVDSMLSVDICNLFSMILSGDDLEFWKRAMSWKNLKLIKNKDSSLENLRVNRPQIVVSSSGFCTNGRILDYLQKYVKDENSMIVFSGYVGDNPSYLAYRIKNSQYAKYLQFNHTRVKNKANCITMSSYSSHPDHDDLVKYGGSIKTNQIILVHGEYEARCELKEDIEKECSLNNKSTKVIIAKRKLKIQL